MYFDKREWSSIIWKYLSFIQSITQTVREWKTSLQRLLCCGVLESISQSSPLLLSDVLISRYTVSLVRIDKELGGFWSTISIAETIVPDIHRWPGPFQTESVLLSYGNNVFITIYIWISSYVKEYFKSLKVKWFNITVVFSLDVHMASLNEYFVVCHMKLCNTP